MTAYPPTALSHIGFTIIVGLLLSVSLAVPAAQAQQLIMQVSIDEATSEEGLVMVTGTVTCSDPSDFTHVCATVRQSVGRFRSIQGGGVTRSAHVLTSCPSHRRLLLTAESLRAYLRTAESWYTRDVLF
jgi:hypothetical protein